MNYDHIYHAGNFADIFKHLTLIFCLEKLQEKPAPFLVIDTHAGSGKYDLQSEAAAKTGEALTGIINFIKNHDLEHNLCKNYLEILTRLNFHNSEDLSKIRFYPGSPYIIRHFLRAQDRALFCEIRKNEFLQLKKNFSGAKNIFYLNEDGFNLTRSKLPPIETRALVLIDPAYEKASDKISKDYQKVIDSLKEAKKRFAHGIYLVWYPIINKESEQQILQYFHQEIVNLGFEKITRAIFVDNNENSAGKMNSCGVFIINAPYGIEEKLKAVFGIKVNF